MEVKSTDSGDCFDNKEVNAAITKYLNQSNHGYLRFPDNVYFVSMTWQEAYRFYGFNPDTPLLLVVNHIDMFTDIMHEDAEGIVVLQQMAGFKF